MEADPDDIDGGFAEEKEDADVNTLPEADQGVEWSRFCATSRIFSLSP